MTDCTGIVTENNKQRVWIHCHRMLTICSVVFFIFPVFLDGCCEKTYPKKGAGPQKNIIHQHYRAVEGEIFMMPCFECVGQDKEMVWSKTGEDREGNGRFSFGCGSMFQAEAKHSGEYTSFSWSLLSSGSKFSFHLQVVEKNSLKCPEESNIYLVVSEGGTVPCPGLNCSDNTNVIWYKGNKLVSKQKRICAKNGRLHLCQVLEHDTGVYFCERQIIEGVNWTFRRSVNVTVIPYHIPKDPPRITYPQANMTKEVELDQPHTLVCEIYFPFEITFQPKVQWYRHHGGNIEYMTLLHMEREKEELEEIKVRQRAIIEKVTPQYLNDKYTCIASNSVGSKNVTIKLGRKIKEKCQTLVGYIIASLLLVAGLGIVVHVKWLELQLIYKSHFQHGQNSEDKKEYDIFLSYVWSPPSAGLEAVLTLSPRSGLETKEEVDASLSSMDPLTSGEGKDIQTPLHVQLLQVLEQQWGYRLCLLDRDLLPGEAYTSDVVLAIQRSRMLICVLSADYLTNNNAVFELESGVQALLQNSTLKLLPIWTSKSSASLIHLDPQLPTLVQRALKVLPSLVWTPGKSARDTSKFWKSLWKAMPYHRGNLYSCTTNN